MSYQPDDIDKGVLEILKKMKLGESRIADTITALHFLSLMRFGVVDFDVEIEPCDTGQMWVTRYRTSHGVKGFG